jgi:hypothetical protein
MWEERTMRMAGFHWTVLAVAVLCCGCSPESPASGSDAAGTFHPVPPVIGDSARTAKQARPVGELRIGQGQFFSFALPPDWRVGEDGQFALTLVAPDSKAITVMVGNAGLPPNYPPGQFAYDKLMAFQPQNLQLSGARPARPVAGFGQAYEFDVQYSVRGIPSRGVAKVSVATAYDSATMAMTAALTAADQWSGYATWLPQVADQISATNGAAFGMRGIMQQNLKNSTALAETARQYREWSQKTWQQVTDERNASQERKNFAVRENLGAVQTYANPFGTSQPVELPPTYKYYWIDPQDHVVGTDNPSANPNVGSTQEWRKMERSGR